MILMQAPRLVEGRTLAQGLPLAALAAAILLSATATGHGGTSEFSDPVAVSPN